MPFNVEPPKRIPVAAWPAAHPDAAVECLVRLTPPCLLTRSRARGPGQPVGEGFGVVGGIPGVTGLVGRVLVGVGDGEGFGLVVAPGVLVETGEAGPTPAPAGVPVGVTPAGVVAIGPTPGGIDGTAVATGPSPVGVGRPEPKRAEGSLGLVTEDPSGLPTPTDAGPPATTVSTATPVRPAPRTATAWRTLCAPRGGLGAR